MKILVAVDLKSDCAKCVELALPWGERLGATVDLAYVDELAITPPHVADPKVQEVLDRHLTDEKRGQLQALDGLRQRLPAAQRGEVQVLTGPAAAAITQAAAGYDLLVVGTHQRHGLQQLWLGSVAEKIVRSSPVPVLIVRVA